MPLSTRAARLRDAAGALAVASRLRRHERWSRAELQAYQRRRLSAVLRHATRHSPFYRDLYAGVPLAGVIDLEALPIVSKQMLMEDFDRVVTDRRLRLDELERHAARLDGDDRHLGEYRVLATSGSTGERGLFVFDRHEWVTVLAGFLRHAASMEPGPGLPRRKLAAIGAPGPLHMSARVAAGLDFGAYRMLRLPVTASIDDLVHALNDFRPDVLTSYPSIAALLAEEQNRGRLEIRPSTVSTSSEMCTDEMRRRIRAAWDVEPYDLYGATETGVLAVDCSEHAGLHLYEDLTIIEIVDDTGRPVPDGMPGHRLLVTSLFRRTQPLIRYEISDLLTARADLCPCGRPFRLVSRIAGRSTDMLQLATVDGPRIAVHPFHFQAPLEAISDVWQYQIAHDESGIHVRLVLAEGASAAGVHARVHASYVQTLSELGVSRLRVDIRIVPSIEREPGPGGKLKLVTSR